MKSIIAQGINPTEVKFAFEEEDLKSRAAAILKEEAGVEVNIVIGTDSDGSEFYLELHDNEESITDKLYELDYQVTTPAEDTSALMAQIIGSKHIEYGFIGDTLVEVKMPYEAFIEAKENGGII